MKKKINEFLKIFGIEIRKLRLENSFMKNLVFLLEKNQIEVVIDIGANVGQFAQQLRSHGYTKRIISVEPMELAHKFLQKISSGDALWDVYERSAIGSSIGNILMNVSKNSVSSSILPMLDSHLRAAPESKYVSKETVPITTLDMMCKNYDLYGDKYFIKIDTQGYESEVLNGADKALKAAEGILIELSNVPLYEGQVLWWDMISRIEKFGLALYALQSGFVDSNSGKLLQFDAIFMKSSNG